MPGLISSCFFIGTQRTKKTPSLIGAQIWPPSAIVAHKMKTKSKIAIRTAQSLSLFFRLRNAFWFRLGHNKDYTLLFMSVMRWCANLQIKRNSIGASVNSDWAIQLGKIHANRATLSIDDSMMIVWTVYAFRMRHKMTNVHRQRGQTPHATACIPTEDKTEGKKNENPSIKSKYKSHSKHSIKSSSVSKQFLFCCCCCCRCSASTLM